jgi:hypothetical protein
MKTTSSRGSRFLRAVSVTGVGMACFGAMVLAQKNAVQPQPQADRLSPITVPTRGAGGRGGPPQRPEGVMPTAPAGFTVSIYAEMPSPRMMVYAPNGDLFVSSPQSNNITVLRDANNDGVFEMRGVYAQGAAAAPRGGGGGAGGGAGRGAGAPGGGLGGGGGARGGGIGPGAGAPPAAAAAPAAPAAAPANARPANAAPGTNPTINGPLLGASAPACTPPPASVPGPGTLAAPFGLAFNTRC